MPCAICLCDYKDPRILPCGHSFCEVCLKDAVINFKLICPSCRKKHKNIDISSFPKNYGLIDEVEKRKEELHNSNSKLSQKKKKSTTSSKNQKTFEKSNPIILDPQIDEQITKTITKVCELKIRMGWFRLEANLKRLIFAFVFLFLTLTSIAFIYLIATSQSDCREKGWIWHSIWTLEHILFIIWFICYNNISSENSDTSTTRLILYKVLLIFDFFWIIIIAFLIFSDCIPANDDKIGILILGGAEICFNLIFCSLNFLYFLKIYLNRKK